MTEQLAYTARDAADACGVSLDTIRRAIRSGDLVPADPRIDGRPVAVTLITRGELERWLMNRTRKSA